MSNNSPNSERFEELCAGYVLDALEPAEREEFEGMLQNASETQLRSYHNMRSTADHLAFSVDRAEPSSSVLDRIMERIDTSKTGTAATPITSATSDQKSSGGMSRSAMAMAASFALLLITLALIFYSFDLNSEINDKDELIAQKNAEITELKTENQQKDEMLSILGARTVDLVMMDGLEVNPNGYGKIIWDAEKQQALLQVSNLPAVPQGKAYQLWLIRNNEPVPSATFTVANQTGQGSFFKVEQLADANQQNANAFAITLEPEGGSQQPTGDMYLLGNVQQNSN